MQIQQKIRPLSALVTAGFLLLFSLLCLVRPGYARYVTCLTASAEITAATAPQPHILQLDSNGVRQDFVAQWQTVGGEQYLSFTVSNTDVTAQHIPTQDMRVHIRIFVPEGGNNQEIRLGNLAFTVRLSTATTVFRSEADYLSTRTPMYEQRAENGWIYSFYQTVKDTDGQSVRQEISPVLKGGSVSDISVHLTVQNTQVDCSEFVVYVNRV